MAAGFKWERKNLFSRQKNDAEARRTKERIEKQEVLIPIQPFAQNAYCFGDIYLLSGKSYRSVILVVKRKLSDCHWSKSMRAVLHREYRLAH